MIYDFSFRWERNISIFVERPVGTLLLQREDRERFTKELVIRTPPTCKRYNFTCFNSNI